MTARITCSIKTIVSPLSLIDKFFQNPDHPISLGRAQTCHDLIEQKQFWIGGERPRYFHTLAIGQRQCRCALFALAIEIEPAQNVVRMRPGLRNRFPMQQGPNDHVVFDFECGKRAHDLKGAAYATPADLVGREPGDLFACKIDGATIGPENAGNHIEQRGLAGAVWPDDREKCRLAGPQN